jgi:hypothetical protein
MWAYFFRCRCGRQILLPSQILRETSEGPRGLAMDEGPLDFLCGFCKTRFEGLPPSPDRGDFSGLVPRGGNCLWKVECKCGRHNCAERTTLYVFYLGDETPSEIAWLAHNELRTSLCAQGHETSINPDEVLAEKLQ